MRSPNAKVQRKLFILLGGGVVLFLLPIVAHEAQLVGQYSWILAIISTALFLSIFIWSMIGWACPRCGYPMYLRKSKLGEISVPWPSRRCSSCQLDLTLAFID